VLDIPLGGERNLVQLRSDPRYVELCAALWKRLAPDVAGAADPASLAHSLEVV
jgi:sulfonate transport system ATP-binding protein